MRYIFKQELLIEVEANSLPEAQEKLLSNNFSSSEAEITVAIQCKPTINCNLKTCSSCGTCIGETKLFCNNPKSDNYSDYIDANMSCSNWIEIKSKFKDFIKQRF